MSDQERMDGPELVPELVPDAKLAEFELQLARAMRRVDAPEGFVERVMETSANPAEKGEGDAAAARDVADAGVDGRSGCGSAGAGNVWCPATASAAGAGQGGPAVCRGDAGDRSCAGTDPAAVAASGFEVK